MKIAKSSLETIQKQFELDCNLKEANELQKNKVYLSKSKALPGARIVADTDIFFRAIMFMDKVYIMADEEIFAGCEEVFKDASPEWFCKFPNLRLIDRILNEYGREIADTHIYFLPDEDALHVEEKGSLIWLDREDIASIKEKNDFCHALCYSPTQPDVIAVAMKNDSPVWESDVPLADKVKDMKGMAGASLDGEYVRQIGINVRKEFQGEGLAVYLTSLLKQKIMEEGLLPFYGTSESHSVSRTVAVKAGFLPAWCEIYVKKSKEKRE